MDLKTIQKNYDKLTANERFSLVFAAAAAVMIVIALP